MRWSERQLAMLREIGVRLWLPPGDAAEGFGVAADRDGPAEPAGRAAPTSLADLANPRGAVSAKTMPVVSGPARPPARAPAHSLARPPDGPPARPMAPPAPPAPPAPHEPADAVLAMGWPALREAASACTACALCDGRRRSVFGVGNERAHWMIVGEAPGEPEDAQGEPFVGKAGQLLDNMLLAIGLTRVDAAPAQQVYIAHAVKCRPPGNRSPTPDELARCEAFLIRQMQLVQPRIILAMGKFAPQMLGSAAPVGTLRGRVHDYHGVPLIVTYAPAYLLRQPEDKARAWDDLCLAAETLQTILQATAQADPTP